jgi:hypothetical protein
MISIVTAPARKAAQAGVRCSLVSAIAAP